MRPTEACIKNNKVCENFTKYPVRCDLCINQSFFTPVKTVNKTGLRTYKKSSRMGAKFEESLQKKLLENISREKYGLELEEESEK